MLWPRHAAVSVMTGVVAASLVATVPAAADARSTAAVDAHRAPAKERPLAVTPVSPIMGERTTFSGHVPARAPRPVRLQSHASGSWRTVATGRTSARGRFGLSTTAPHSTRAVRFRVLAPAGTFRHLRMPAAHSAPTSISPLAQAATLTGPAATSPGAALVLRAHFDPARRGRPVDVQRRTATGWEVVAQTRESLNGHATWHGSAPATAGVVTYRALARRWHGSAASLATLAVDVVAAPSGATLLSKSTGFLTHVSCADSTFCVAVDDTGNATTYDGSTWSSPSPVDARLRPSDVSCPTATFCMAVEDRGFALTYDGLRWSAPVAVDPAGGPVAVSCTSPTFCVAVGLEGTATTYDGTAWSAPVAVSSSSFRDVSCPTVGHCVALTSGGRSYRYDGTSWSGPIKFAEGEQTNALSCADPTFCVAVDSDGHGYTYNGGAWSAPTVAGGQLVSVSCPTTTYCAAGTAAGAVTTYDGAAWSAPSATGLALSSDIACSSGASCVLVGDSGAAVRTGTTWTATQPDPPSGGMVSVSCVDAASCLAVDADGRVFAWDGTAWGHPVTVDSTGRPTSLSCANRGLCALVDDQGRAATFDGTTWSSPTPVSVSALRGVSCAPTSSPVGDATCVAVGDDLAAYSLTADGWTAAPAIDDAALRDVSCATRSWCVAVDVDGRSVTDDAGTWGSPVPVTATPLVPDPAISCPVTGFCMVTLRWGGTRTYDGTGWSSAGAISDSPPWGSPQAVSCATETSCTAALYGGTSRYDGIEWSSADLGLGTGLTDISCPTPDFCAAVDEYGYARVLG